jgi:hypothetical protein
VKVNMCMFLSFVYICSTVGYPVIKGVEIPLSGLTPPYLVSVQGQDMDFQRGRSWSLFSVQ